MNFIHLYENRKPLKFLNLDQVKNISIKQASYFKHESEEANFKSAVRCLVEFDGANETQAFYVFFVREEKEDYIAEAETAVYNRIAKALWDGEKHIDVVIKIGYLTF